MFLRVKAFPVTYKEYHSVVNAMPSAISQLMKSHMCSQDTHIIEPSLLINGIELKSPKCTNKHKISYFFLAKERSHKRETLLEFRTIRHFMAKGFVS
jgi:hypothetical protein